MGLLGIVIQARIWAKRFPAKVLADLGGETVLQHVIKRALQVEGADKVIVATPDMALLPTIRQYGAEAFLGAEHNVLKRYVDCAKAYGLDTVVRITADCPFIDHKVINSLISLYLSGDYDYVSNVLERSYPYGLDAEVVSLKALECIQNHTQEQKYTEHVTLYIREHIHDFKVANLKADDDYTAFDWRLDNPEDLPYLRALYAKCDANVLRSFDFVAKMTRRVRLDAQRLRIPSRPGGEPHGDSTPNVGNAATGADKTSHNSEPAWYERGHRVASPSP